MTIPTELSRHTSMQRGIQAKKLEAKGAPPNSSFFSAHRALKSLNHTEAMQNVHPNWSINLKHSITRCAAKQIASYNELANERKSLDASPQTQKPKPETGFPSIVSVNAYA